VVRKRTGAYLDNLATEMARGVGETLTSVAASMQVEPQDQPVLFATFQENFTRIFPSQDTSAEDVLVAMREVMTESETLVRYVEV